MQSRFDRGYPSRIVTPEPPEGSAAPRVRLVVDGYEDTHYNICQVGEKYYGVHQQDGPLDIDNINSRAHPAYVGSSVDRVVASIKAARLDKR